MALRLQVEYFYRIIIKHASYCMIILSCKHRVQNVFLRNKMVSNIEGLDTTVKKKNCFAKQNYSILMDEDLKTNENYYITKMLHY